MLILAIIGGIGVLAVVTVLNANAVYSLITMLNIVVTVEGNILKNNKGDIEQ